MAYFGLFVVKYCEFWLKWLIFCPKMSKYLNFLPPAPITTIIFTPAVFNSIALSGGIYVEGTTRNPGVYMSRGRRILRKEPLRRVKDTKGMTVYCLV